MGVFRVFVDSEDFETGTIRIEVGDVHGVTVTELGGVARSTITVDTHGTVDDFVAAIAVDVGDADAVVALAAVGIGAVGGAVFIAVEEPALGEFAVAPVPRDEGGAGVVAAAHDNAGADAVEVGDASEEAIDAVAVAVSPVVDVAAGGEVVRGREGFAGEAVEDGEELGAVEDVAGARGDHFAVRSGAAAGFVT